MNIGILSCLVSRRERARRRDGRNGFELHYPLIGGACGRARRWSPMKVAMGLAVISVHSDDQPSQPKASAPSA